MEQGPSGVLGGRSYRAGARGFSSELQMTVDATPVVATVVAIAVGTVACRALHPLGGPAAVPPTELRAAASLVCASHPWPTPQRVVVQVIRPGASLSRTPSFHVKAFTVWLVADMRACVDAHSASNHLRQGNERDVTAWNDAAGEGKDATQQDSSGA